MRGQHLSGRSARTLLLGFLTVTALACSDTPTAPSGPGPLAVPGISASELSVAVQDPAVRTAIFQALRASPYSEHKVSLSALLSSPSGAPIVAALARSRGVANAEVAVALERMGSLDLYMPSEAHRLAWTGGSVPQVADARELSAGALPIWGAGVVATTVDPRRGSTSDPLLLIQPTEPRAYRIGLYQEGSSAAVQGSRESQEGAMIIHREGASIDSVQFADLLRAGSGGPAWAKACPPEQPELCGGEGGGGGGSGGQDDPVWQTLGETYLTTIATDHVCDNNLCDLGDDNEFEFTGRWQYGSVVESNTIRRTGVPATGTVSGLYLLLLNRVTTLQAPITVSLKETDAIGDDDFGTLYLGQADLNQWVFWGYPTLTPYVAARFTW